IRRVLGLLPRRGGVDEKPAWPLVMIDGASFRLVVGGVADFVRGNIQVVVEEEPNLTVAISWIPHVNLAQIEILVKIYGIATTELEVEIRMRELDLGHQRVVGIAQPACPARVIQPPEPAIQ